MFKPHTVLGLGLWLIAIKFLSIGSSWQLRLYMLTGLVLVCVYLFHLVRETILKPAIREAQHADTFTENGSKTPHQESESPESRV